MRMALTLLALSLAGCAYVDPSDAVKTEAEAVAIGKKACGDNSTVKYATLGRDGQWVVWGPSPRDVFEEVRINKRDGSVAEACVLNSR